MTADVDSLEKQRDELRDQLAIATAAKTSEESQGALIDFANKEAEPLAADHPGARRSCVLSVVPCVSTNAPLAKSPEQNEWHKSQGGGAKLSNQRSRAVEHSFLTCIFRFSQVEVAPFSKTRGATGFGRNTAAPIETLACSGRGWRGQTRQVVLAWYR